MALAGGCNHSLAVAEDGCVLVFGRNNFGQLGTGDRERTLVPMRIQLMPGPVRQVAAKHMHSAVVTDHGELFMFGAGLRGRLGMGDDLDRLEFTRMPAERLGGERVHMVACAKLFTVVATESGAVYTFGYGLAPVLGHPDLSMEYFPRRVDALIGHRIVMVACGICHTAALSEEGLLFTWGRGGHGMLGHHDRFDQQLPRQVDAEFFGGEKVVFVATGSHHTVALTAGGQVYTWGFAEDGALGLGNVDIARIPVPMLVDPETFDGSTPIMAACGHEFTLVLTNDGSVWVCGEIGLWLDGENDEERDNFVFTQIPAENFGGERVVTMGTGTHHALALTESGKMFTWGPGGLSSALGLGNQSAYFTPTNVHEELLRQGFPGIGLIGRSRRTPASHALAFASGLHHRLRMRSDVAASPVSLLEENLVKMIAEMTLEWPRGPDVGPGGLLTMIGGLQRDLGEQEQEVETQD